MAMSKRQRASHVKKAEKLLPGATVRAYAVGRAGPNPVAVVGAMLATAVGFSVLVVALTGQFVIIGLLPMLIVQHFLSPPRGIVVADQGVALTSRSLWNGKPLQVLGAIAHGYVHPTDTSLGRVMVRVGNDEVWLAKAEEALLRQALSGPLVATPPPPAPAF
jgi:hypothetical protein